MEQHGPKLIDITVRPSKSFKWKLKECLPYKTYLQLLRQSDLLLMSIEVVLFTWAQLAIQLKYESLVAESSIFFQVAFNQKKNFRNGHGTRTGSNDFIDDTKVDDKSTEQSFLDKFYFGTAKNAVGKSDQQLQMALSANDRKSGSL
ncbi:Uncharacterized protein BM_BM17686 [Brugia malayi]|uniref:Uncharacterized protein n=1 Tax=Brugia malayi TaxID=6279 RepID=A0A4E9FLF7_BRUMA|nr:Uncharacterized protein BM_BM17686 [Brugia malayi]VIO97294.1 Uncharacterized protein BM_BM17686 [Brugia malayi]